MIQKFLNLLGNNNVFLFDIKYHNELISYDNTLKLIDVDSLILNLK
jgi:hypothetical protein